MKSILDAEIRVSRHDPSGCAHLTTNRLKLDQRYRVKVTKTSNELLAIVAML